MLQCICFLLGSWRFTHAGGSRMLRTHAHGPTALPAGTRGILLSCVNYKERLAAQEAINLLTEVRKAPRPAGLGLSTSRP